MSDTLKERLNSHSNAFQGLLSLIPAKYYYDEDSKNQWKRDKSKRKRAAKFDPDVGTSALDEARRREITENDDSLSESSIIYDDKGNEIKLDEADDIEDDEGSQASASEDRELTIDAEVSLNKIDSLEETEPASVTQAPRTSSPPESDARKIQEEAKPGDKKNPKGIQELRQKLQDRVNELRSKRKAPGSSAAGAPRSREELLEARKLREETRLKRRREDLPGNPSSNEELPETEERKELPSVNSQAKQDSLMFGKVKFGNDTLDERKKPKKRQPVDQLRIIEQRNAKIAQLDSEKRDEITENAQWSSAILRSTGAKLKDNEKLLKKTVKAQQKRKQRSERDWKARLATVAHNKAAREAQRNANLEARKEQKGMKVKSKHKKRAGFEGKSRKKH